MKADRLSLIGSRIKEIRTEKKMTLRELAKRSNLSPGLISKIENFRTMPSISVLIDISNSLQIDVGELVKNINAEDELPYLLIKKEAQELEIRADSPELLYNFILSQNLYGSSIRVNLVTIPGEVYRKPVATHAYELIYAVKGDITYVIGQDICVMAEGDTLYFDGRIAHSVQNHASTACILFKIYLSGSSES